MSEATSSVGYWALFSLDCEAAEAACSPSSQQQPSCWRLQYIEKEFSASIIMPGL